MSKRRPFYDEDLAYIHDAGFSGFARDRAPGLLGILKGTGITDGLVVDVGCGSGVWARRLGDAGYRVRGLDVSPAMVALARRRAPKAELEVGSLWSYRFPRCRAVTALGEVVCYDGARASPRRFAALFRRIFAALEPGGLLIFDVAEVGLDRRRQPASFAGDDWACLIRFEYDDEHERLTRHITSFRRLRDLYRRSDERHVLQLCRGRHVAEWLRSAGFLVRPVRKLGTQRLQPGRLAFVARKPSGPRRLAPN